jgi:hypothetical protein
MKILNKVMDAVCGLMTKYFLAFCPKEAQRKRNCPNCSDKEFDEYRKLYTNTTRWV